MKVIESASASRRVRGQNRRSPVPGDGLVGRLDAHLRATGLLPPACTLTVAFSGGLDSAVLLDLISVLCDAWGWRITAAHFDHRMRPGSAEDAAWVESRCAAVGIPCRVGRAERVPQNEADARVQRYAFLEAARLRLGGERTVTAHHADDQAETVCLRLLRGSNPEGLSGVRARRAPGIVRPLLPFWRHELEAYARAAGVEHRDDPSNRSLRVLRNRLRHGVLADLEEDAASVKVALLRLARESERARRAWSRRLDEADARLASARERDRIVVAAPRLSAYDEPTRVRLLRRWSRALGAALGRGGARVARTFLRRARSGARVDLGGGVLLRREYDAWVLERSVGRTPDAERPLAIAIPGSDAMGPETGRGEGGRGGEGTATIGGRRYRIAWGASPAGPGERASFRLQDVEFPVVVRGRRSGDRLRRAAGRRSIKRLFADHRVPRSLRDRWPIVADARGVLWVPGVERSVRATAAAAWTLVVEPLGGPSVKTETGD